MNARMILSTCMLITAGTLATAAAAGPDRQRVEVAALPKIAEVDPRFQSYNIEMAEIVGGRFWAPYPKPGASAVPENTQGSGGLNLASNLFRQRPPADLTNPRLLNMAKGLGPVYIRVSGSWANAIFFQDDDLPKLAAPPKGFANVLTRRQWAGVVAFANAVDGRLTTSFAVSDGARDSSGAWSPVEARKLLRYTREIGGQVHSAELINEPNLGAVSGLPAGYNAANFARDLAIFRGFITREAPSLKIVGPGSSGEEDGKGPFPDNIASEAMLGTQPAAKLDIFSYHFYGARSQRCQKMSPGTGIAPENALSEDWLSRTDRALAFYKRLHDRYAPEIPIWLNETAQTSCGGDKWASSFLDSFRYVDQMGRLAKQGVSAVFHNTLAASDYGLIDEATMTPRPNYWAALLWARLMGPVVLDAGPQQTGLHVYAHCLRGGRGGGVALAAINLSQTATTTLSLPSRVHRYTLSADDLKAETVRLNGSALALDGDRLPAMRPTASRAGEVTLPSASITFLAMPSAGNKSCR
ncbi:MAG: hypothetical protein ABIT04_02510 [Novosphingobium sp.]